MTTSVHLLISVEWEQNIIFKSQCNYMHSWCQVQSTPRNGYREEEHFRVFCGSREILKPGYPARIVLCSLNHNGTWKHQMRFVHLQKGKCRVSLRLAWQKLLAKSWPKENACFSPSLMWDVTSEGGRKGVCPRQTEQALHISFSVWNNTWVWLWSQPKWGHRPGCERGSFQRRQINIRDSRHKGGS